MKLDQLDKLSIKFAKACWKGISLGFLLLVAIIIIKNPKGQIAYLTELIFKTLFWVLVTIGLGAFFGLFGRGTWLMLRKKFR